MIRLFLDAEFDGFAGPLISLALVPLDQRLSEFYAITTHRAQDEWVIKNVVPVLGPAYRWDPKNLPGMLATYLNQFAEPVSVTADWPDDFTYLMKALIKGPGEMAKLDHKFGMVLDCSLPGTADTSQVPHNALWDARALRDSWKAANP